MTLNISGNVVASPCKVSTESQNMDIKLSTTDLQTADLNAANSSSDWVQFNVMLQDCPPGTSSVTATFHGTADADDPETLYVNTGDAENVAVQLESQTGEACGDGKTSTLDIASAVGGKPTWALQTRAYSKAGGVTPGLISAVVTMSLEYK
ncbi:TPA: type 1 fimbrial protein [Citrobacter amalonaticus]|uniref:Type 1 fimbrial protein n=1 Tax=Citrobacter amalonaticus TaxID=35703 RepID=A0A9C7V3G9_CITAM|nr:type 1 fimbrial protein [Citrobacter amalonaticus]